jgi:tetratricopeptide (TPR) repeat protein
LARDLARASGTEALEILSILQMSSAEFMDGDPQKAQETAREAVGMAWVKGMQGLVSRGLVDLGNAFFTRGGPDDLIQAEKYFQEALNNALIAKDRRNEIRARFSLGSLAVKKGAIEEALPNLEQAKAFYLAGGFRNELLLTLTLIGRSTRNKGSYDEALAAFQQQLGLANTPSTIAGAHLEIAQVLLCQEDYPAALIHLDESHKLERELSNKSQLGYVLMNRARALWQLGRYEEASADFDQAAALAAGRYLALASAVDQFRAEMNVNRNRFDLARGMILRFSKQADPTDLETLGEAERLQGLIETSLHNKRAVQLCEAAVEKARKSSDPQILSMAQFASSMAMLEMNQWQAARDRAMEAAKSFERARQLDSGWRAYLVASLASRGLNDSEAARKYLSQSAAALAALKAKWGEEAFARYSKRPDIQSAIWQFNRLSGQ